MVKAISNHLVKLFLSCLAVLLELNLFINGEASAQGNPSAVLGDMNGDGVANRLDRDFFLIALFDPVSYEAFTGLKAVERGDINQDGALNFKDIFPFGRLIGYTDTEIYAQIELLTGLPTGDANGDGCVNLIDFAILRSQFSSTGEFLESDFNYDGKVSLLDFVALKANFGRCL